MLALDFELYSYCKHQHTVYCIIGEFSVPSVSTKRSLKCSVGSCLGKTLLFSNVITERKRVNNAVCFFEYLFRQLSKCKYM